MSNMGYFRTIYELSKDPVNGGYDPTGTVFLGFCVLFSPVLLPLFYIGRLTQKVLEGRYE